MLINFLIVLTALYFYKLFCLLFSFPMQFSRYSGPNPIFSSVNDEKMAVGPTQRAPIFHDRRK